MAEKSDSIYVFECESCGGRWETRSRLANGKSCPECKIFLLPKEVKKQNEGEKIGSARYECLACEHTDTVRGKRKDYSEVLLCPKCNGLFVDLFYLRKYQHLKPVRQIEQGVVTINEMREENGLEVLPIKEAAAPLKSIEVGVDIDVSDALKGLKAVERQAKKTARALKEVDTITSKLTGG